MIDGIGKLLQTGREQRLSRDIESSHLLLSKVDLAFGFDAALSGPDSRPLLLEREILRASLRRARGDLAAAEQLLNDIEQQFSGEAGLYGFFCRYEKAFTLFNRGDYVTAGDQFLLAYHAATVDTEKAMALVNAVICFDHLGLEAQSFCSELKQLVDGLADSKIRSIILNQTINLGLHAAFRSGNIKAVLVDSELAHQGIWDQNSHFYRWVSLLPFHAHYEPKPPVLLARTPSEQYQGLQQFRFRTLTGVTHPADDNVRNPFEFVDRLYLWTWRWMVDPTQCPIEHLLKLLRRTLIGESIVSLTEEDRHLLRNVLLWVSLFDELADPAFLEKAIEIDRGLRTPMPLLDLEALTVRWLLALRDKDKVKARDYLKCAQANALWKDPDIHFGQLVSRLSGENGKTLPESLGGLERRLRKMLADSHDETGHIRLRVNVNTGELEHTRSGKRVYSPSMVQALSLLNEHPSVRCEELLRACFGLSNYDPQVHNARLFNLFSRLRLHCGPVPSFHIKAGSVYSKGSWTHLSFKRSGSGSPQIHSEWRTLVQGLRNTPSGTARKRGTMSLSKLPQHGPITRSLIEKHLNVPRSTANRILTRWVKKGTLQKSGAGKNTIYRFPLVEQFESLESV